MTLLHIVWFIWGFIKSAVTRIGYELTKDLLLLATNFVREAAEHPEWGPDERRAWVAEQLREHAIQTGNPIADSVINMLIEIALQRVKTG